jgi:hypothetical protein
MRPGTKNAPHLNGESSLSDDEVKWLRTMYVLKRIGHIRIDPEDALFEA